MPNRVTSRSHLILLTSQTVERHLEFLVPENLKRVSYLNFNLPYNVKLTRSEIGHKVQEVDEEDDGRIEPFRNSRPVTR